jgi:hypothetical protein
MRPILICFTLMSASAALFAACGEGTGGTTSSSGASGSGGTDGTGGATNCEGVYFVDFDTDGGHPCDICLHDKCCAEVAYCRDKDCIECVNYLQPSCGARPRAVNDCLYKFCQPICSPGWPPSASSSASGG